MSQIMSYEEKQTLKLSHNRRVNKDKPWRPPPKLSFSTQMVFTPYQWNVNDSHPSTRSCCNNKHWQLLSATWHVCWPFSFSLARSYPSAFTKSWGYLHPSQGEKVEVPCPLCPFLSNMASMSQSNGALQSKWEGKILMFPEYQDKASTLLEEDLHSLLSLPSNSSSRAAQCIHFADEETEARGY